VAGGIVIEALGVTARVPSLPVGDRKAKEETGSGAWPSFGDGDWSTWNDGVGWSYHGQIARPPSVGIPIPWERCAGFQCLMQPPAYRPDFFGSYVRDAATRMDVYSGGPEYPKKKRAFVLGVSAVDKGSGVTLAPASPGTTLGEPDDSMDGVPIDPTVRQIMIGGEEVDPNGCLYLQLPTNVRKDVTPSVTGCQWYAWTLGFGPLHDAAMTWSRHPLVAGIGDEDLENAFDAGARILAQDGDTKIADWDPRLDPGSPSYDPNLYLNDDCPTYMEFIILPAWRQTFPSAYGGENWAQHKYNNISNPDDAYNLCVAHFSNIKVVSSMDWGMAHHPGISILGDDGMVLETGGVSAGVVVHEYGHIVGLNERGEGDNPGVLNDPNALMRTVYPAGSEVNRNERAFFYLTARRPPPPLAAKPQVWND
jgi:hypothetical protein